MILRLNYFFYSHQMNSFGSFGEFFFYTEKLVVWWDELVEGLLVDGRTSCLMGWSLM